jgi:hypothetical protein
MKNKKLPLMVVGLLLAPLSANATFVFSNVQLTNNSLTFTIDGDMTGYGVTTPFQYDHSLAIIYTGDLWTGPALSDANSYFPNTWSQNVFDNEDFLITGNTVTSAPGRHYTWSMYHGSLADATASNRQVSVSFGDYLNPSADGALTFVWGNGGDSSLHTVLGSVRTWNQTSVPEPGALGLFGLGLMSIFFARRRLRALHASRMDEQYGNNFRFA